MEQVSVRTQISEASSPSFPPWFAEVAAFAHVLTHKEILKAVQEQVRFARARFGHYDLIDFCAVLIGYILSGEPTLLTFYERLAPFASSFMAHLGATAYLIAQRFLVFLLPLIKLRWRCSVHSFTRICSRATLSLRLVVYSTGQVGSGE